MSSLFLDLLAFFLFTYFFLFFLPSRGILCVGNGTGSATAFCFRTFSTFFGIVLFAFEGAGLVCTLFLFLSGVIRSPSISPSLSLSLSFYISLSSSLPPPVGAPYPREHGEEAALPEGAGGGPGDGVHAEQHVRPCELPQTARQHP